MKPKTKIPNTRVPPARLFALKVSPDFVTYCANSPIGSRRSFRFGLHAICSTGEVLVELSDGRRTQVNSFFSRPGGVQPEQRRSQVEVTDARAAFDLLDDMMRQWPQRPQAR